MAGLTNLFWLIGFTLLFGNVSAYSKPAIDSVVKCKFDALSKSSFESVRVGAHSASKADAALCNNDTSADAVAETTALSISKVFADAFMGAVVDCYAEGDAHYTINGKSFATAQAYAFAEAFAEASVVSKTCHHCLAASELLAHSYADIFISAAHEAEVSIKGVAKGGRDEDAYTIISQHLVEKTWVAFAQVIVKAKAKVDECRATAEVRVATGDLDDLNKVECVVDTAAASDYKVQDACEHAAEDLALSVCDMQERTSEVLHVQAEAVAEAVAIAIAEISANCTIEGQGVACAVGFSEISQAAEAVAEAYAGAFMGATAECSDLCHTDEDDMAAAIGSVLVTATANVYQYHCTGPDSYFLIDEVEAQIVEATVTALSQLLAQATVVTSDNRMTACMVDMDMSSAIAPITSMVEQGNLVLAGTAVAPPPVAAAASRLNPFALTPFQVDGPEPFDDGSAEDVPSPEDELFDSGSAALEGPSAIAPEPETLTDSGTDGIALAPEPGTQAGPLVQPPPAAPQPMDMESRGAAATTLSVEAPAPVERAVQAPAPATVLLTVEAPAPVLPPVEAPAPVLPAANRAGSTADAEEPIILGSEEQNGSGDEAARTSEEQVTEELAEQEPIPTETEPKPDILITSTITSTDDSSDTGTADTTSDTGTTNSKPDGKVAVEQESPKPHPQPVKKPAQKPAPPHRKRPHVASKPGPHKGRPAKRPPIRRKPALRRRPSRAPIRRPHKGQPPRRQPKGRVAKQPKRHPVPRRSKAPSKAARGRRPLPRPTPKRRPAARQGRRRPAVSRWQPRKPRRRVPRRGPQRVVQRRRRPAPKKAQQKKGVPVKRRQRRPRAPRRPRK